MTSRRAAAAPGQREPDFAATEIHARPWPRRALAAVAVTAALSVSMGAAIVTSDPVSGLNLFVERWSASSGGSLRDLSGLLPLGFAFAAGMVSAVNPCGFSLLPAYLGLFLGERDDVAQSSLARLQRGLLVGLTVSLGFVSLFTLVGLLLGAGAQLLVEWLPWIGMLIGVALIVAGGYRLAGGALYASAPERLGARVGGGPGGGLRGYFLFGLSYGIASLSCTLPIFLAVIGGTLTTARLFPMVSALSLYALGMGAVILALTLAIAVFKSALAAGLRRAVPYVEPIGTVALIAAGMYIVYYWLTIGGLVI